jgi:predicted CoA-binding protein
VGSREDLDSKETTEEAEEEEAIAKAREDGLDAIDNGCEKRQLRKMPGVSL